MKNAACFFAFILTFLTLQPAFGNMETKAEMNCCMKSKCGKNNEQQRKNKCENNGCNPFMACALGNFFLSQKPFQLSYSFTIVKQQRFILNDNRVARGSSDCWHPPRNNVFI